MSNTMNKAVTVTVLGRSGGQDTALEVTGPKHEVEAWAEDYLKAYHPAGYDTKVKTVSDDGVTMTVRSNRSSTCD